MDEGDSGYISLLARTHVAIVTADAIVAKIPRIYFEGEMIAMLFALRHRGLRGILFLLPDRARQRIWGRWCAAFTGRIICTF